MIWMCVYRHDSGFVYQHSVWGGDVGWRKNEMHTPLVKVNIECNVPELMSEYS